MIMYVCACVYMAIYLEPYKNFTGVMTIVVIVFDCEFLYKTLAK